MTLQMTNAHAQEWSPIVWAVIRRNFSYIPGHVSGPEDLFQEGMIGLLRALPRYDKSRSKFVTWATNTARFAILDSLRSNAFGPRDSEIAVLSLNNKTDEMAAEPIDLIADHSDEYSARDIVLAIDSLPERTRLILRLRFVDWTQEEVGELLGLTASRICQLEGSARLALAA